MFLLVASLNFHPGLAEQSQKAESLHTCFTGIHWAGPEDDWHTGGKGRYHISFGDGFALPGDDRWERAAWP